MTKNDNRTLPLPDFDQLPPEAVATRIRSQLREGAQPTSGDPNAIKPEVAGPPESDSKVGPDPGPPINPPARGDPTNPARPRG